MARYREAYEESQSHLRAVAGQGVPQWVFALDEMTLGEVRDIGLLLAGAEERRRAARTALHAVLELAALGGDTASGHSTADWIAGESARTDNDHAWQDGLDRFISVVNYARKAGVIYINGDFRPSDSPGSDTTDGWIVPDFGNDAT
ncbi:MAG: hypothetical protein KC912_23015 [Proteobacteria bacterium]|nr:hypothetical protein [Pseudomonadota bacterium]